MFQTFDYTFFPSSNGIVISLESDSIQSIDVFGTPDEVKSQPFEESHTTKGNNAFIVTRIQTCFPSEIEVDKNEAFTIGGLILVKIKRKTKSSSFKGTVNLSYKDYEGNSYQQNYEIGYYFHPEEQFFSD